MNTRFLEAFFWAARLQSFKAAAAKLHLTQAAISGRIAALEADFGQRLFDRDNRGVSLTSAGYTLLTYTERLLELDRQMQQAMSHPTTLQGKVRLGVIESIVHTWMLPFIERLQSAHPAMELELTVEPTAQLHDLLKRGALDVALQAEPLLENMMVNRELGTLGMSWVVDRANVVRGRLALRQIAEYPIITFAKGSQPHRAVISLLDQHGLRATKMHCVSSIAAITRLLKVTGGVATLPLEMAPESASRPVYRRLACDVPLPPLRLFASYSNDPANSLNEALVNLAREEADRFSSMFPGASP